MIGIAVAGTAGIAKERAMTPEQRRAVITEFNLRKGIAVATLSGVMSACFAYGLAAGDPIRALTLRHGTPELWQGLPVLVVVLVGGFTTNFVWSVYLNVRNRSGHEYLASQAGKFRVLLLKNYLLCALAGTTWYFQFFFYTMGETQMGVYKFSSWTLHMASIIIFSSLWGLALKEWRGAGALAMRLLFASLVLLVLSTVIVGYGNYLGAART
jgi:L-rhamnose-H+ transport protein